ncbi:MAG: stage V sporulation protein M [Clostridiales bacterium]|nr:stage V sporulation protein M [Clostridiales bacterium]
MKFKVIKLPKFLSVIVKKILCIPKE